MVVPHECADAIELRTKITFSFVDRLRILFGAHVTVTTKTYTKLPVGDICWESATTVDPFIEDRVQRSVCDETYDSSNTRRQRTDKRIAESRRIAEKRKSQTEAPG